MATNNSERVGRAEAVLLRNYKQPPFVLTRGEGCYVQDVEGRRFLDLSGGIAVLSVGHCHPRLAKAIADQAGRLMHVSNLFYNDRAIALAEAIVARTPFDRVYFANSGTEANEAMLKLARRHAFDRGEPQRTQFVSTMQSFHGRTLGALSVTGQPKYHEGMEPLIPGVQFVPYGDLEAMRAAVGSKTAAVIVEPVQAEGGVHVPDPAYLRGLRELCDEAGALLLFDEVQTGYGRTGRFLGLEHSGVVPDACSLAKGIAGGFPLAAMAVREPLADALPPGSHASTFGGNALACAAGLAVLDIFDEEQLVERADREGQWLHAELRGLAAEFPELATGARGLGLLQGLVLADGVDGIDLIGRLRDHGLLLTIAGPSVLRWVPPLTVERKELQAGLEIVRKVLEQVREGHRSREADLG